MNSRVLASVTIPAALFLILCVTLFLKHMQSIRTYAFVILCKKKKGQSEAVPLLYISICYINTNSEKHLLKNETCKNNTQLGETYWYKEQKIRCKKLQQ